MKKTCIQIIFILFCLFIMNNGFCAETETYLVDANRLSIRKCASTKCDVLGYVSKYDTILIESNDGNWAKVVFPDGLIGYVSSKYIKKVIRNKDGKLEAEKQEDDINWAKIDPFGWLKYSILPFILFFLGIVIVSYSRFQKQIKTDRS